MSEPFYYDDEYDDEGPQGSADPEIRTEYEAALGRLILAHNDVDRHLTLLIECCVKALGSPKDLRLPNGGFNERLATLRMLRDVQPALRLSYLDFDELSDLNGQRNAVAHGHFEQNPYDGEYVLIKNSKTMKNYPAKRLDDITARLAAQAQQLKPQVWFFDIKIPPVPEDPRLTR